MSGLAERLSDRVGLQVQKGVGLSGFTTFRIGGPARYLLVARSCEQVCAGAAAAAELGLRCCILGWGSNVLVDDAGFDGLVLINTAGTVEVDGRRIRAESGASLQRLVEIAARRGLAGLGFAAGIPGTIGGAVAGNAGAYGRAVGDVLSEVVLVSSSGASRRKAGPGDLALDYRSSAIRRTGEIVESVALELTEGDPVQLWAEVESNLERRRGRLPPPEVPSAGSYFRNLAPKRPGEQRVAAGKLLDDCGCRGLRIGDAMVYEGHANVIVNAGRATAAQVLELAQEMRLRVRERFGVDLEPEVRFLSSTGP